MRKKGIELQKEYILQLLSDVGQTRTGKKKKKKKRESGMLSASEFEKKERGWSR